MKLECPVCEREITPDPERHCPVCEADLSALVLYRETQKAGRPGGWLRYGWVFLLILLPLAFLAARWTVPPAPETVRTVVVTATLVGLEPGDETPTDSPTPSPSPSPTVTALPTPSPSPSLTAPAPEPPRIEAQANLNCRSGPGPGFPVVGFLQSGAQQPVLATRTDGAWLMIPHPQKEAFGCWIWAGGATLSGDMQTVPGIPPSP